MKELVPLLVTMFVLIAVGFLVRKLSIVSQEGQKCMTNMVIYVILPCNIVKSFLVELPEGVFATFLAVLVISIIIQIVSVILGKILYHKEEPQKKASLQYGVICSNAGFMGNPVAEGVFGSVGLAMASIYLIPQRIMMWSSGLAAFAGESDKKQVFKKVITHPCIIACILGILLMVCGVSLPEVLMNPLSSLSNCNTAMSMLVIGMILADGDIKSLLDKKVLFYCLLRLVLMPAAVYVGCKLAGMSDLVVGVSTILAAMPAGATTSILASKYDCDAWFATKLVVASTILSIVTLPLWCIFLVG